MNTTPVHEQAELPRISVVTPCFNGSQFLEGTILSVLSQEYPLIEYLIFDGGSSDGSVDIIRRYEDRLAYWVSEPDGGQSDAINRGWRQSRGDILAYLNADDQYAPGAIPAVVDFLQRHPDVEIVYGSCYSTMPSGAQYLYKPPEFDLEQLLIENFIPQSTVFIRRSVLDKVDFLDPSLRYCLDYDLWLRAALAGVRFQRLAGPALASFRIWPGSKTSGDPDGWLAERLRVSECAFSSKSAPVGIDQLKAYARAKAYMSVAYGISLTGDLRPVRALLRRALATAPGIIRDPSFLRLLGATLLGRRGSQLVRQAKWAVSGWLS